MVPRNGRQISRSNIKSKSFRKNHDGNDVDDEVIHYIDYIFNRAQKTPYYTKMNKYQEFFSYIIFAIWFIAKVLQGFWPDSINASNKLEISHVYYIVF